VRSLVVVNPAAHGGRAGRHLERLREAFRRRGLDADFHCTSEPGEATRRVAGLAPGAVDRVIAAGGDGTLFEVVNGLMARPEAGRETLGILPLGTGNAFSRDLGLEPGALEDGVERLVAGRTRPVDVVEARCAGERFHFVNMLGLGFVVRAARAAQRLKFLGRAAYSLGAVACLVHLPERRLVLELDGERRDPVDCLFLEIANSRYTGTRFLMAPEARIDDGLLDVVLARRLPRRRALRLFPTIYDGLHLQAPEVSVHRAAQVRILAPEGENCLVDGEFRGTTPLTLTCRPGALRVVN